VHLSLDAEFSRGFGKLPIDSWRPAIDNYNVPAVAPEQTQDTIHSARALKLQRRSPVDRIHMYRY
jgi:hypothetical protein